MAVSPVDTDTPAPPPTNTPTANQWAKGAANPSYSDVRDHPDLYYGEKVIWGCTINKFLGTDPNDALSTDLTCERIEGTQNDDVGEFFIKVPFTLNTDPMHAGDQLAVYGTVDQPAQGTNGFGATITEPQIDAVYIDDSQLDAAQAPDVTPTAPNFGP